MIKSLIAIFVLSNFVLIGSSSAEPPVQVNVPSFKPSCMGGPITPFCQPMPKSTPTHSQQFSKNDAVSSTTPNCDGAQKFEDRVGNWMLSRLNAGAGALRSQQIVAGGLSEIIQYYEANCPQESKKLNDLQSAYHSAVENCEQLTSGSGKCQKTSPGFYSGTNLDTPNQFSENNLQSAQSPEEAEIAALIQHQLDAEGSANELQDRLSRESQRLNQNSLNMINSISSGTSSNSSTSVSRQNCGRICTAN